MAEDHVDLVVLHKLVEVLQKELVNDEAVVLDQDRALLHGDQVVHHVLFDQFFVLHHPRVLLAQTQQVQEDIQRYLVVFVSQDLLDDVRRDLQIRTVQHLQLQLFLQTDDHRVLLILLLSRNALVQQKTSSHRY